MSEESAGAPRDAQGVSQDVSRPALPPTALPRTGYASPLLGLPQAIPAQDEDPQAAAVDSEGVAWHYGAPLVEQRDLEEHSVIVDRSHRAVLLVAGPDAPEFLNNLLSQKLDALTAPAGTSALDLDLHGHVLHHVDIALTEDGFYLDLPSDQAATLAEFLTKMVFWSQVEITRPDAAVLTILTGERAPLVDVTGIPTLAARESDWASPTRRLDLIVARDQLTAVVAALRERGATPAGLMAYTAERIKALEPELAADLDEKSIPHEVPGWIGRDGHAGAVHLNKGCYRGQETVARVENLGRSPRVLVMLQLDGSAPELPLPGAEITANGRRVGRVGSVAHDVDFGPIALALVKRSALDAALEVDGAAVSIDPDSLPVEGGEQAGRVAVDKLRGRTR